MMAKLAEKKITSVHITRILCPICQERGFPFPYFETGNTVCPVCIRTTPGYLEVCSGTIFIACAGTDISSLSKEFELENEMLTTNEYAI